jgi:hypothetical protein
MASDNNPGTPRALWLLLSDEHERDGYALKPAKWEGPGEYQQFSLPGNDIGVLRKVPQLYTAARRNWPPIPVPTSVGAP